jgi:hypothetical protein
MQLSALSEQLRIALQQQNISTILLQQLGQQLYNYANLNYDKIIITDKFNLIWECLYHPDGYFIAQYLPIVRQSQAKTTIFTSNKTLHILHLAIPSYNYNNYLNIAEERHALYEVLAGAIAANRVKLHTLLCPSWEKLILLLQQQWDIIILTAHRLVIQQVNYINLRTQAGDSILITDAQLYLALKQTKVKCILLGICNSAELSFNLHQAGIPYVIGMQAVILDRAANVFISQFCRYIIVDGNVINAVFMARLALHKLLKIDEYWQQNDIGQWVIPCLYANSNQVLTNSEYHANNFIPQQPPPLIGRHEQLCHLETKLLTHKKLWLYGAGGLGKTALASYISHFFGQANITYVEVEQQIIPKQAVILLAVARCPPPDSSWPAMELVPAPEDEFIYYMQYCGADYSELQLRWIYKALNGNYKGFQLLHSFPPSDNPKLLAHRLRQVQRYLRVYQI